MKEIKGFEAWIKERIVLKEKSRGDICTKNFNLGTQFWNTKISKEYLENDVKVLDKKVLGYDSGVDGIFNRPASDNNNTLQKGDSLINTNMNVNNNCFINNNNPETLELIVKYNTSRNSIGVVDTDELNDSVKKMCQIGQKWLSKLKRQNNLSEV